MLAFLSDAIAQQTGIRDYMAGEKVIQGFLAAYLSVTGYYVFRSEAELGKGHADIALEPVVAAFPQVCHGYLIELKYRKRSEAMDPSAVAAVAGEARAADSLSGRRAAGPAVPGRALHRPDHDLPRLGDVLRRGTGRSRACVTLPDARDRRQISLSRATMMATAAPIPAPKRTVI